MRGSLKLTFGIGLLSLVALGIPACGDDDDDTKKPSTGGTGGKDGGTGGTGGVAGSAGTGGVSGGGGTGGAAPVVCGGETCKTYKVAGLFDVGACCSADKCGADVSANVGGLVGLPAGCYRTGAPGNEDSTCPDLTFTNPLDSGPGAFKGCCNHETKKCGYAVDLSSTAGPDMGCLDATGIGDSGAPASCTPAASDASTD
jgi:hypothetical protein